MHMQEIFRPSDVFRKNVQSSLLFIAPAELLIYNGGLSDRDCRNTDSDHSLQCYGEPSRYAQGEDCDGSFFCMKEDQSFNAAS